MLARAVEVILLLQLLPPLLAQAEEIHVGNSQLIPRRNLAQGPQLDPGGRGIGVCVWRSSRSAALRDKSYPAWQRWALALRHCFVFREAVQRWTAVCLTGYRAGTQSHKFFSAPLQVPGSITLSLWTNQHQLLVCCRRSRQKKKKNTEIRNTHQNAFISAALHATHTSLAILPDPELCCLWYRFLFGKLRQIPSGCSIRDALSLFMHSHIKA